MCMCVCVLCAVLAWYAGFFWTSLYHLWNPIHRNMIASNPLFLYTQFKINASNILCVFVCIQEKEKIQCLKNKLKQKPTWISEWLSICIIVGFFWLIKFSVSSKWRTAGSTHMALHWDWILHVTPDLTRQRRQQHHIVYYAILPLPS